MMGRIIGIIILAALAMSVLKLAIILLVLAGLIFRTKETVGLLLVGGSINLLSAHPIIGIVAIASVALLAWLGTKKKPQVGDTPEEPDVLLLPPPPPDTVAEHT